MGKSPLAAEYYVELTMSTEDNPADQTKKKMRLLWDESKMAMSYANVCNVSSTKEEFNLLFGTNQSWAGMQKDIKISLSNRVILNPHAAKRLSIMLLKAVQQYEDKMGEIKLDAETISESLADSNESVPGSSETH